jgi:glutamine cyclotransferase
LRLLAAGLIAASVAALGSCGAPASSKSERAGQPDAAPVPRLTLEVVATYPHDPTAFTQGLLWHRGKLYESTGQYRTSSLREVEPATGRVLRRVDLEPRYFAEGLALAGDRLFQLSYQSEIAWEWDLASFAPRRTFRYRGEGWGLTFDGTRLIQSDGSATLTFRSPADFEVLGERQVLRAGRPQFYLNELEWVKGEIWANVWQTDEILRIDPESGRVTGAVDASGLLSAQERLHTDVLNGIAWDPDRGLFLVTGKYWPKLFAVAIRAAAPATP